MNSIINLVFRKVRSYLYQRLVISSYSHRAVALIYMGIEIICSCLAFMWVLHTNFSGPLVAIIPLFLSLGLWRFVAQSELKYHQQKTRGLV